MKSQKLPLTLVLLLTIFLVACSQDTEQLGVPNESEAQADRGLVLGVGQDEDKPTMDDISTRDDALSGANDLDRIIDDSNHKDNDMVGEDGEKGILENEIEKEDVGNADFPGNVSDSMSGEEDSSLIMGPDWFNVSLKDVNTGRDFSITELDGKIILVETLAMWCSNCLKQQKQVLLLHDLLGDQDDFISLGINIDPNENAEALKSYTFSNGFDWLYTIAPIELSREIGKLYGDQFLNPPSTPMMIIDRDGQVHLLPFGIKNANELFEALQPFLEIEM